MSYNALKCGACMFYDPMQGPNNKDTDRGWCAKKSVYPTKEGPGQLFPKGVNRATAGMLAKPVLVRKHSLVANCDFAQRRLVPLI